MPEYFATNRQYQSSGGLWIGVLTVIAVFSIWLLLKPGWSTAPEPLKAIAVLSGDTSVKGTIIFEQASPGDLVRVTGHIENLDPNALRGFHIHALGDVSGGCLSTGAHYNPFGRIHGAPEDNERHVGDLGNVKSDSNGVATVNIEDDKISLYQPYSILGRAVVVHTGTDDLGVGNFDDSKTTGHAGGRAACGVIGIAG
ncbi:Superoxide dismutase [Cu-Zn] [Tulasnella sp. 418]|nr:Superoxide dismutase [Cu-Zn] [Tulasnella sp. 418]